MAAPINRWVSSNGTWSDAASWSLGHIPLGTEVPTFGAWSQQSINSGPVTGVGGDANMFPNIIFQTDYGGKVMGPGSPLDIGLNSSTDPTSRLVYRGTGDAWIRDAVGLGDYVFDTPANVSLDCDPTLGGTVTNLFVKRGSIVCEATCNFSAGVVKLDGAGAVVTIAEKATTEFLPAEIIVEQGVLACNRSASSVTMAVTVNGGTAKFTGPLVAAVGGHTLKFFVGRDGRLMYEPITDPAPPSAREPDVYFDGVLDLSGSRFDIAFSRFVQGVNGVVFGVPGTIETFNPFGVDIDLGKEYP